MAATRLITMHQNKGKSVAKSLSDRTDCAKNGEKTENGQFISSYACQAESVDEEFMLSKREYERLTGRHPKGNIIAYQIRQSFKPGEITPEEANQVGYETAMRFTKGNHAFIVATHTDKAHIHNHIIFNSTSLDCTHKFRDFFFVGLALQRLSDIICLEHGLSVIEKKKPSERVKRTTYPEKKSFRDDIRDAIDQILREGSVKDFDELLYKLEDAGYEIKRGKHISLKGKDQKRFIRLSSLGDGYTEDDLKKILIGEMEHAFYDNEKAEKQPKTYQRKKEDHEFDLLIDIQKKLAQGKGKYYVRFAKNYNTKQVAKAVLYLKQHDIRSYDDLEKNMKTATARFTKISASIKEKEKQLAEIQVFKKHIFDYFKTKDVYADYRKCGYSKKFLEEHRQEILLHKAAKNAFDELHLKKLPKVKDLSAEYAEILAEKKKLYDEYRQVKKDMQEIQRAKYDIDQFLKSDEEQKKERVRKHNITR